MRFGDSDDAEAGLVVGQRLQPHVADVGAKGGEHRGGRVHGRDHVVAGAPVGLVEVADEADAQALHPGVETGAEVRHRHISGAGVAWIVAGDRLQHDGAVLDIPGQRAAIVHRPGQRQDAALADAAIGRLDAGDAAEGGRQADRAAGVAAHRDRREGGRDRGAGAARRTAGKAVELPGVARRRPGQVVGRAAGGELVRRQLAEQYGAGLIAACRRRRRRRRARRSRHRAEWPVVAMPAVS